MNLDLLNRAFQTASKDKLVKFTKSKLANANDLYIVTTANNKRYVIKILTTQDFKTIPTEILIQEKISATGLKPPRYIQLGNGKSVGNIGDRKFVLYEYIEGRHESCATQSLIYEIGAALATIHQSIGGIIVPLNDAQWLRRENVHHGLRIYSGKLNVTLSKLLKENEHIVKGILPQATIHGDLTLNNFLTQNNKITAIFDFETAESTVRLLDISRTFLALMRTADQPANTILEGLRKGYDTTADLPLTDLELESFSTATRYVATACAIWCVNHAQEGAAKAYLRIIESTDWL